jgi:hypothetical protein
MRTNAGRVRNEHGESTRRHPRTRRCAYMFLIVYSQNNSAIPEMRGAIRGGRLTGAAYLALRTSAAKLSRPPDSRTNRSYRTPRLGGRCLQGTVRRAAGGRLREAFSRRENGRRLMARVRRFHARFIPFVPGTCAICQVKCPECETPPPPEAVRARVPPDAISAINHRHRSAGTS